MAYWIEVTSGSRWDRLLREKDVRLDAPNKLRYQNFFRGLKAGDFVFHYLTATLTLPKERKSSVIAISKVASNPIAGEKRIEARCSSTLILPKSIPYSELSRINPKSKNFRLLVKRGMQRYLTQISKSDFNFILDAYPMNKKRFFKSRVGRQLSRL